MRSISSKSGRFPASGFIKPDAGRFSNFPCWSRKPLSKSLLTNTYKNSGRELWELILAQMAPAQAKLLQEVRLVCVEEGIAVIEAGHYVDWMQNRLAVPLKRALQNIHKDITDVEFRKRHSVTIPPVKRWALTGYRLKLETLPMPLLSKPPILTRSPY